MTTGLRFDPPALTEALVRAVGGRRSYDGPGGVVLGKALLSRPDGAPLILARGGFAADRHLLREHVTAEADHVLLRTAPGSTGDGLRLGLDAGAATGAGLDEVYARAMPAPPAHIAADDFVRLAQLYATTSARRSAGTWRSSRSARPWSSPARS